MKMTSRTSITSTMGVTLISLMGGRLKRPPRFTVGALRKIAMAYARSSSWRERIAENSAAKASSRLE